MIDDKRKFIFVENPKTATFSIKKALMGKDFLYNSEDPRIPTISHKIPMLLKANYPEKWQNYTSFVVARNTWDRAHSFFQFYRDIAGSVSYQSMSFDKWVALDLPPPEEEHLRSAMHIEGRFDDVLCQLRYVQDVDEIIVLRSFASNARKIELQTGMDRICSILNINAMKIPTEENNYGRTNHPIIWEKETIEFIRYKYAEEIERFSFEEPIVKES